ncbi:MAG TPA: DUF5670 family protein [Clostridium sp.]
MGFLSWIGGIVLCFWVLGLFSVGGTLIHWLLLIAVVVFS